MDKNEKKQSSRDKLISKMKTTDNIAKWSVGSTAL